MTTVYGLEASALLAANVRGALLEQNAVPWGAVAIGTLIGAERVGRPARAMGVGSAYLNATLASPPRVALATAVTAVGGEARRGDSGASWRPPRPTRGPRRP